MGFKCGIVGLPNVGKSTIFNALTETNKAEAANYPFATINPNVGRVAVPDERLKILSKINSSKKIIPTYMDFVDIAGLIKGASTGEGLGNKFLAHIREMDAIVHVVRCFENQNIAHISSSINPINDIESVEIELKLSDLEFLENKYSNLEKKVKAGDNEFKIHLNIIKNILENSNNLENLNFNKWSNEELKIINNFNLIINKPMFYVCNVDEESILNGNKFSKLVQEENKKNKKITILISASIESQISQIKNEKDKLDFFKELELKQTALKKVVKVGYNLLDLITYFTSGPKETRAWTIVNNSKAPKAAGKIHTDFEKGFICAETISYDDFINYNGETGCREAGKLRQEGKNYIVQEGDIFNFLFNV